MITKIKLNKALKIVGFIIFSLLIWFILLILLLSSNEINYNKNEALSNHTETIMITIIEAEDIETLEDIEQRKMNEYNKIEFM